jgi:hypothetical protein
MPALRTFAELSASGSSVKRVAADAVKDDFPSFPFEAPVVTPIVV